MGKASRSKQRLTTREKIANQRAAERRAQVRTRVSLVIGSVVAVIAIVVAFVLIKGVSNNSSTTASLPTGTALSKIVSNATNVPAATLATIGKGTIQTAPTALTGQPALTKNGKPEIVYIGAEYCPYCAAERWPTVVALSRFGTFSNLGVTRSDTSDVYPSTKTLTFHGSSYTSKYVAFSPVEQTDPNRKTLETPTAQEDALIAKYDSPPYVPSASQGAIPFIDFGNKYLISGASYSPQILQGKSWAQISAALSDPSSPIAKAVGGTANYMTAAICKLTNNQPANVCTAPSITALSGKV
ncbi:MAG TPA: DUF929 family protein [Streptosporangiaceae bacterium]|nr:DUF929 family protein [Streptosporangiaceae bacterium]